jgi:hypothetical protein
MKSLKHTRRSVLKGMLAGSAVTVALPLLDYFLNGNGTAMAATGAPLPNRFGTWFWGCGLTPGFWEPKVTGSDYELTEHMAALAPYRKQLSIFTGLKTFLDGNPLVPHLSGAGGVFVGTAGKEPDPSVDVLVADTIGSTTRFRSIEVTSTGYASHTQSRRSPSVINSSEISPLALYTRLFGPEFKDPNAAVFTPDPKVMVRKSVLSAVKDERTRLSGLVGASDRARLDEYFTSLRQIEHEMDMQLTKPAPCESCSIPEKPPEAAGSLDIEVGAAAHKQFAQLLAHAIACDQTRVLNVSFSDGASSLRKSGEATTHHIYTHEEQLDTKLGYQPGAFYFEGRVLQAFADLLAALSSIKEGDGTLLDRTIIMMASECGFAKHHTLEGIPVILAGGAGGRIKSGYHIAAPGDPVTRVGLTVQQALGVSTNSWGRGSMQTSKQFTELLA